MQLPADVRNEVDADDEADEAAQAFGLVREEPDEDQVEAAELPSWYLWPCNVPVFRLWTRVQTQRRSSFSGLPALDYASVIAYMQHVARIKPRHFAETFQALRAMESAGIEVWEEKQRD